jgi:transcriptional regulator with XRE-family HTH domain
MVLLRHLIGDALRRLRLRQGRTLREVSAAARVSLGYLSEVERGQKEASSELLASICGALGAPLSQVLREVSDNFALAELQNEPVFSGVREPSPDMSDIRAGQHPDSQAHTHPIARAGARQLAAPGRPGLPGASGRLADAARQKLGLGPRQLVPAEPMLETAMPLTEVAFEQVARTAQDITDMVPV